MDKIFDNIRKFNFHFDHSSIHASAFIISLYYIASEETFQVNENANSASC